MAAISAIITTSGKIKNAANALFNSLKRYFCSGPISGFLWKPAKRNSMSPVMPGGLQGFMIRYSAARRLLLKHKKSGRKAAEDLRAYPSALCFFNTSREWGGGEKWTFTAACGMKKRGYSIIVVAYRDSELFRRSQQAGLSVEGLKMRSAGFIDPFIILRIRKIYRKYNVRAVFLNLSADLKAGGLVAAMCGMPKIIYRRGLAKPIRRSRMNRYLLAKVVTDIIATSEDTKRGILQNFPEMPRPDKIRIIYNGVELPADWGQLNGSRMMVGSAGRISSEKGFLLLTGLGRLLKEQDIPFGIDLAGGGHQLEHIKNEVKKAGLDSHFRFRGFVNDMDEFYRSVNILVLTSGKEGFANVLLEAMSYGKPVIAFDIGSPSELIEEGKNGFIVEKNNLEAMAARIVELYNEPGKLKRMGENARQRISKDFSLEKHLAAVEAIIR